MIAYLVGVLACLVGIDYRAEGTAAKLMYRRRRSERARDRGAASFAPYIAHVITLKISPHLCPEGHQQTPRLDLTRYDRSCEWREVCTYSSSREALPGVAITPAQAAALNCPMPQHFPNVSQLSAPVQTATPPYPIPIQRIPAPPPPPPNPPTPPPPPPPPPPPRGGRPGFVYIRISI